MTIFHTAIDSPVGPLLLAAGDAGLCLIQFAGTRQPRSLPADWQPGSHAVLDAAAAQLRAYFEGRRQRFDLPLAPRGTEFQRQVWRQLATIPYGRTVSYAELAAQLGRPRAVRAVGAANGRNPLPIVLPCHRVIGSDGSLTGFAGGLETKRWLLALEDALPTGSNLALPLGTAPALGAGRPDQCLSPGRSRP
ncbi:methylated-DNA--[protein]-cysteine S-methyltransferase [Corticibacter populi]|uniref:Methylated-DNA--protein-cysteine methyltransferase n=1 Tax=Corticibacter populi TaxID=1550736 RepID=A0A3M6QY02_9BURK|nr:methylated-DNA--[protein]-cysteine S-methyltransferase [Corticibacter populi]RMX07906.1 methylated-DNA--[protein]-cysteine S-methyltransferase [Corticibacter populi]RZS35145.1 methylated-DNA-[protein]-cysteine S-methyltransferase [Corticibacter populi]